MKKRQILLKRCLATAGQIQILTHRLIRGIYEVCCGCGLRRHVPSFIDIGSGIQTLLMRIDIPGAGRSHKTTLISFFKIGNVG